MRRKPVVAIVGRPNVGKSTLFNRIFGERKAVVHPLPGMTRDRHYADAAYRMRPFTVIDTGGYEDSTGSHLLQQMRQQSIIAIDESDRVIFLADAHTPDDPVDQEILERLRSSGRPFFLAVNKCDNVYMENQAIADFSRYGLDAVYHISALKGDGIYDLMDDVTKDFAMWDVDTETLDDTRTSVAIVGRQNAGKSTLLNRLLGQERVIANPMPGTTRDAIDADVQVDGMPFTIIDTAGIRRRGKIENGPEKLSVHSSFRAIERSHVSVLVIDGSEGITAQDQHVAGYILERRKAAIILINKWDLVPDREAAFGAILKNIRREFNFMPWAPILTVSALTGQRTFKLWDLIRNCALNFRKEFQTAELNLVLKKAVSYVSPPTHKGNTLTIKYITQTGSKPPTFSLFVNNPDFLHFGYKRYLANQFYEQLGLEGTPLRLRIRRKAPPRGWDANAREEWYAERGGSPKRRKSAGAYLEDGTDISHQFGLEDDFGIWENAFEGGGDEDEGDDE